MRLAGMEAFRFLDDLNIEWVNLPKNWRFRFVLLVVLSLLACGGVLWILWVPFELISWCVSISAEWLMVHALLPGDYTVVSESLEDARVVRLSEFIYAMGVWSLIVSVFNARWPVGACGLFLLAVSVQLYGAYYVPRSLFILFYLRLHLVGALGLVAAPFP